MLYLFFKWLHIISIIAWMAGVLYGYRLLVNLAERWDNRDNRELLTLMFKRLYRAITMPAMGVAIIAGVALISLQPAFGMAGWFQLKFLCVLLLIGATIHMNRLLRKALQKDGSLPASKTLRILNEVPTLLMLIIVGLVVFKPF